MITVNPGGLQAAGAFQVVFRGTGTLGATGHANGTGVSYNTYGEAAILGAVIGGSGQGTSDQVAVHLRMSPAYITASGGYKNWVEREYCRRPDTESQLRRRPAPQDVAKRRDPTWTNRLDTYKTD